MLTVRQAAQRLAISSSKLYQLAAERKTAHYRLGGKIVFAESDIDAFLLSCGVEPAAAARARTASKGTFQHLNAQRLAVAWRDQGVELSARPRPASAAGAGPGAGKPT